MAVRCGFSVLVFSVFQPPLESCRGSPVAILFSCSIIERFLATLPPE